MVHVVLLPGLVLYHIEEDVNGRVRVLGNRAISRDRYVGLWYRATSTEHSQNRQTQYSAGSTGHFKYCPFSVTLRPSICLKRIGFRISLVWQLLRVTTVEHEVGGDMNKPKIVLDGEGGEKPWSTRVELRGRV